jgi:hypothetical protein
MNDKESLLKDLLGRYKSAVVAFSGGVDCSLFLLPGNLTRVWHHESLMVKKSLYRN